MAIVSAPGQQPGQKGLCVICGRSMPFKFLSAGLVDASGHQVFACYGHIWDGARFIVGWAHFAIEQRRALGLAAPEMEYGGIGGRPLY